MSNSLNQCQFIGRLGRDPESRNLNNGDAVTTFSLAVDWGNKEKGGTEWVRCVAFKKLAEIVNEYLTKGKQVYVSGRMRTREFEDKEGVKRQVTEVVLDQMQMLGSRDDGQRSERQESRAPAKSAKPSSSGFDDMDDDIPF